MLAADREPVGVLEQLGLATDGFEDGRAADAGTRRDLLDRRGCIAAGGEQAPSGFDDPLSCSARPVAPEGAVV